jgi:ubiquitin-conjugating enzyme E2 variant
MLLGRRAALLSAALMLPAGGTAGLSTCGTHVRHACSSAFVGAFVANSAPGCLRRVPVGCAQHRHLSGHASYEAPAARREHLLQLCMLAEPSSDAPVQEAAVSARQGSAKATDYYKPLVEGDVLESTDEHRAIVGFSYVALAALFVKGVVLLPPMDAWVALGTVLSVLVGYEFADIGSGVYHWSMDNYGSKSTPIFGTQIEAFQGHHELPWTITYRQVCNNIYKICQATAPFCIAGILLINNPYVLMWMATAISFINLSQELHKWSHQGREATAWWINTLQDYNIIVSRKGHLAHHKPPFEGNYCIVSGHCNPIADKLGLFRGLEKVVYLLTGNMARCETNERLLEDRVVDLGIKRASATLKR